MTIEKWVLKLKIKQSIKNIDKYKRFLKTTKEWLSNEEKYLKHLEEKLEMTEIYEELNNKNKGGKNGIKKKPIACD
jgi:hypothetical protein